ncbi:MAG: amino acid permease [Gemmatimonadaceae bacterium]
MSAPPKVARIVPAAPALVRVLGVRALAANVINNMVGSGIFVLPAAVAAILGPSAVAAYLTCAFAIGLIALCFAEVGSRVHASGGAYAYVEAAFGPYLGFLAGILILMGQITSSAAVATVLVGSLIALAPAAGGPVGRSAFLLLLYGGVAVVNARDVRAGARLMESLTAAKIAPLVLLAIAGLVVGRTEYLRGMHLPPLHDVGRASLVLFFAFLGVEGALSSSGEVRDPARTVPRAVFLGLGSVVVLYAVIQVVSQGVLGPALGAHTDAPLAATAERMFGGTGRGLILAATTLSAFGYVSGDMLATPRVMFAFGGDGILPAKFGAVHPRFRTPYVAVAVYGAACCGVALTGTFRTLAAFGVVAILFVYLGCCLAVLQLRRRDVRADGPPFRIIGGPVVPVLACGCVLWLLASATRTELIAVGLAVVLASLAYVIRRHRRSDALSEPQGGGAVSLTHPEG